MAFTPPLRHMAVWLTQRLRRCLCPSKGDGSQVIAGSQPAGLPAEVDDKLHKAPISTLRSSELKKQFDTQDAVPSPSTAEAFTAFVKAERAKWEPVVSAVGSTKVRSSKMHCR